MLLHFAGAGLEGFEGIAHEAALWRCCVVPPEDARRLQNPTSRGRPPRMHPSRALVMRVMRSDTVRVDSLRGSAGVLTQADTLQYVVSIMIKFSLGNHKFKGWAPVAFISVYPLTNLSVLPVHCCAHDPSKCQLA